MPPIPPEKRTEAQAKAAAEMKANRGSEPTSGPFVPMLRSPEVMLRAMAMGDYLRFKAGLPAKLSELTILIVARDWNQDYEWSTHKAAALKAGLDPSTVDAIANRRRPAKMPADEAVVYDFCTELLRDRSVSDATYARAIATLGEPVTIDMVGVVGYYTFLAMTMNVAQTPAPPGTTDRLPTVAR
jgi:4-carboxymuconolactone decarboxylase